MKDLIYDYSNDWMRHLAGGEPFSSFPRPSVFSFACPLPSLAFALYYRVLVRCGHQGKLSASWMVLVSPRRLHFICTCVELTPIDSRTSSGCCVLSLKVNASRRHSIDGVSVVVLRSAR
jgi:hypothetical protein